MFIMANIGAYPIDPTSAVGNFRLLAGDSDGTPIEPTPPATEPTEADYNIWSDLEIEALISQSGGVVARAIAMGYTQLAAQAASVSSSIRTDDLSVTTTSRSGEFIKLAQLWSDIADKDDELAASDSFDIVYSQRDCPSCWAEGSSREFCGCGGW